MAAYTLRVYDPKTKREQIVKLEENKKMKDKVDITTLDMFILKNAKYGLDETTMLQSDRDGKARLIRFLNDSMKTPNPRIKENISSDSILYITYNREGKKYLEPIYKSEFLYDIASEFDNYRAEYNKYKKRHPEVKGAALEEYRKNLFGKVTSERTIDMWINLLFNDLDRSTFIHEIKHDDKYMASSYKNRDGKIVVLKDLLENLQKHKLLLKNSDEEIKEIKDTFGYLNRVIKTNFFTRYKTIRGAVIFREQYWNKKNAIVNHTGSGIAETPKPIGEIDVEKAKKIQFGTKVVEAELEEDKTLSEVINMHTGKVAYHDRTDELEYERRAAQARQLELIEFLRQEKVKKMK